MLVEKVSKNVQSKYTLCTETGVPELPPQRKKGVFG
jgi:hypothetical protein